MNEFLCAAGEPTFNGYSLNLLIDDACDRAPTFAHVVSSLTMK